ncbi:MAG: thiol:disulfide interchange protein DsbA/DsbL [Deltaproteobacteria bacterium]|jgi:thiol:disulfide interchange protein DsbA|nr:thiol:disulfide interchange protein DsbA/DsbL [Deltaproteobacteria bacterium]
MKKSSPSAFISFLSPILFLSFIVFILSLQSSLLAQENGGKADKAAPQNSAPKKPAPNIPVQTISLDKPIRWDDRDNKIEVVYFFWYGCGACRLADESFNAFAASLGPDVRVVKLPAAFAGEQWENHARLFFSLQLLDKEPILRQNVFAAVLGNPNDPHRSRGLGLLTQEAQTTFAFAHGIPREDFKKAYNSPEVKAKMVQASQFTTLSGVDATPSIVINGLRWFSWGQGFFEQAAIEIDKERQRLKAKAEGNQEGQAQDKKINDKI